MVCPTSLQERLFVTATTSNNTDGRSGSARDSLLSTGGQTDASLVLIWLVTNDSSITAGNSCKSPAVTRLLLDVADYSTFGKGGKGENVAYCKGCLLSTVDELAGMLTLDSNEGLSAKLVSVGISEDNPSKRGATTAVVNDILYNTTDVPITLSEVERAQLRRVFVQAGVGFELWAIIRLRKCQKQRINEDESVQWHANASAHG